MTDNESKGAEQGPITPDAPAPTPAPKPAKLKKPKRVTATTPDGAWRYSVSPKGEEVWTRVKGASDKPAAEAASTVSDDEFSERIVKLGHGLKDLVVGEGKDLLQIGKKKGLRFLDGLAAVVEEGKKK